MAPERYIEIIHTVPPELDAAVRQALRYAMPRLRLDRRVAYRFFVAGSAEQWHGRTFTDPQGGLQGAVWTGDDSTVWIRADLSPREARHTTLHEAVHVLELLSPESGLADEWERTAQRFADAHLPILERSLRR